MRIRVNENKEIADLVKQGLEQTGGYCPCRRERTPDTRCIVVDSGAVCNLDITAADRLEAFRKSLNARGIALYFASHIGSLNDRFRFQRELFAGSANAMDTAIEHIEVMTSYGNAELYFYSQLNWDRDNEVVKDFMAIVRNHFQK